MNQAATALHAEAGDDVARAESLAKERLAANPNDAEALEALGLVRAAQGRTDEAVELFRQTAALVPGHPTADLNAGLCLMRSKRSIDAVPFLQRAIAIQPNNAAARHACSKALIVRVAGARDLAEAQLHLGEAVRIEPDNPHLWRDYGAALQYSSREVESEAALRRALELEPDNADTHYQYALTLTELEREDEALKHLERALELVPQHRAAQIDRDRLAARGERRSKRKMARYPRAAKEFEDFDKFVAEYVLGGFRDVKPRLSNTTPVFTLGSCFAQNIARSLVKLGVPTEYLRYAEDINNTYGNRYFLEWVSGTDRPETEPFDTLIGPERRVQLRDAIAAADTVIISLGVAPAFFRRDNGRFASTFGANFQAALASDEFEFRTTSVAENVGNLQVMIAALRTLSPSCCVVLTVSPVPLKATFEYPSAVIADCISKSTLRVAAAELDRTGIANLYYWPSFEMVRWFGGHAGQLFGIDDGSPFHISQSHIDRILLSFIRVFGKGELAATAEAAAANAA
ncbi:GSCFA domain-containing protein [Roseiterribacter gracilis]